MTEETDKQAVAEKPDAQAKPAAEGADAREQGDDLDTLLAKFDEKTEPKVGAPPKPETKADKGNDPILQRLTELEKRDAEREFQRDIQPVVQKVRGAVPVELYDDADIKDWIDRQAKADPRLTRAWLNRREDPATFDKVIGGLGRKLADKFSKIPDKQATEDREAVTAAVRGASTKAPEGKAPDYSNLSKEQFRERVEKDFGYTPNV